MTNRLKLILGFELVCSLHFNAGQHQDKFTYCSSDKQDKRETISIQLAEETVA